MNIAIILAGGSGSRLGGERPKQLIEVAGHSILAHTTGVFECHPLIDEIAIVIRADCIADVEAIVRSEGFRKVRKILEGGRERYDSSMAALNAYGDDDDCLLFHDAVRPLVSSRIISDCIHALEHHDAVGVATKATDTIWQVGEGGCIADIPSRALLRNAQTPQCFRRRVIRRAYDLALADPAFTVTDDCGVVRRYLPDQPIYVVEGEPTNIKVTYRHDLLLLETLLRDKR